MAEIDYGYSLEEEEIDEEIRPEPIIEVPPPPPPVERKYVRTTPVKETAIIVEDITLVITQKDDNDPSIIFQVAMAPLSNGDVPEIVIDKPIELTEQGFRRGDILGCIADNMIKMYPGRFTADPTVIVNNYATEIRKETNRFDIFKDDVLFTLANTFQLDVN